MLSWDKGNAPLRAQRISQVYKRRNDTNNEQKWDGWRVGNLTPVFEPILWFTKPYKIGGMLADNIIQYGVGAYNHSAFSKYGIENQNIIALRSDKNDSGLHPTQKPLQLMQFLIELTTTEGQVVLDPFAGSGTTLVAALKLGRHFIGYEQEKSYYDVAFQRIQKEKDNLQNQLF